MTTNVLIIDDDRELCALLADFLKLEGFETRAQHDGALAVQHCRDNAYDAIILDLGLPNMDGVTVLEKWRRDGRKKYLRSTR